MATTGQKYTDKQLLLDSVGTRVFKNGAKLIDAISVRQSIADSIESLWGLVGDSIPLDSIQNLQEVLDVGSDATISAPFSLTANGGAFVINGNVISYIFSDASFTISNSFSSEQVQFSGVYLGDTHNIVMGRNGVVTDSFSSSGKTRSRLNHDNILQGNSNYTLKANVDKGGVSPNAYDVVFTPEATWDIDGTARVRDLPLGTENEVVIVDSLGNLKKKIMILPETYVQTIASGYVNSTITRTITGNEVFIHIKTIFTNTGTGSNNPRDFVEFSNVLPVNANGFSWFKIESSGGLVDSITEANGDFGGIELNDVSSYTNGVDATGDVTKLFFAGLNKGTGVNYTFDSLTASAPLDREDIPSSNSYVNESPKDLSLEGLDIKVMNNAEYTESTDSVNAGGVYTYYIKGILL